MEGVVAARRLRKSMLQNSEDLGSINFGSLNISSSSRKSSSKVLEEDGNNNFLRKIKVKFLVKLMITIILLIACVLTNLIFGNKALENKFVNNIVGMYNKDYTKQEFIEGFENICDNIYKNLNYVFPKKIVNCIQGGYINNVKPYLMNVTVSNVFSKQSKEHNVNIYESDEIKIYEEQKEKLESNNNANEVIKENIQNESKEAQNGIGGGIETIEDSSSISSIEEEIKEIKSLNISIIWPVNGTITSKYGVREEIFKEIGNYHTGLDISNKLGTEIKSATSGKVVKVEQNNKYYGKTIEIENQGVIFKYAHLNEILVENGKQINQGDLIGKMGSTGYSTGPHLHFEVRYNSKTVDPYLLLT